MKTMLLNIFLCHREHRVLYSCVMNRIYSSRFNFYYFTVFSKRSVSDLFNVTCILIDLGDSIRDTFTRYFMK